MARPDVIGSYRIVRSLGAGGMGEVYVAHDEKLNRKVAIKAIRAEHRLDGEAKQRFLREARILSSLNHPNICKIHGYLETEDGDYLALEFIEGETLTEVARRNLDHATGLRLAQQIARVLVTTHAEGIVHRDLKPMNVMVTPGGEIRVLDFGLAHAAAAGAGTLQPAGVPEPTGSEAEGDPERTMTFDELGAVPAQERGFETRAGRISGTPQYMSPEQARGEVVTAASDMYSLGLLLQYLFTGRPPYEDGLDLKTLLDRVRRGETRPVAGVPRHLLSLIEALKRLAPADRPTAVQALRRIEAILDAPRRRARRLAAVAVLLVVAGAGLKYTFDLRRERGVAVAARQEAERRRDQAESLIDFMLGDLRTRLSELDRLDVLGAVGDQAMDYYASLGEAELDDEELQRRSTALRQIGQVALAGNNLPSAARAFDEALTLAASSVERDPESEARRLALGESEFYVGNVCYLQRDLDGAVAHFEAYRSAGEELVRRDPSNASYRLELSYGHTNLGAVHQDRGELDLALRHIGRSIEIKRALVDSFPDDDGYRESLANGLSWLAVLSLQGGDLEGALSRYEEEMQMRRALGGRRPDDKNGRYLEMVCLGHLGAATRSLGRIKPAIRHFEESIDLGYGLLRHDPDNGEWRRELGYGLEQLGDLQAAEGAAESAKVRLAESERLLLQLIEGDPTNLERQLDVIALRCIQSDAARSRGDGEGAIAFADLAIQRLHGAFEETGDRDAEMAWARARLSRGLALAALDRREEAREEWALALGRIEPLAREQRDPRPRSVWAMALLCLAETEKAEPVVASLLEAGYREPRFMALVNFSGRGF